MLIVGWIFGALLAVMVSSSPSIASSWSSWMLPAAGRGRGCGAHALSQTLLVPSSPLLTSSYFRHPWNSKDHCGSLEVEWVEPMWMQNDLLFAHDHEGV